MEQDELTLRGVAHLVPLPYKVSSYSIITEREEPILYFLGGFFFGASASFQMDQDTVWHGSRWRRLL